MLLVATAACTKNYDATDQEAKPTLTARPDSPALTQTSEQLAVPTKNPHGNQILGTIAIATTLKNKVKNTDVLYIIVRGQQAGPPVAVKRFVGPKFPLSYAIGAENAMMPNASQAFDAAVPMTVAARLSHSGNAMPAKGDLEGFYAKNPTKPGTMNVDITIDQERS